MAANSGAPTRARLAVPEPDPGGGRRQGLTAASLFMVLILFWIVTRIEYVIVLGLFSLLLGTVLEGPVHRLQERHIPRPAAIFLTYVAIIGALVAMVVLIVPPVVHQAESFRDDIPAQLEQLQGDWRRSANPLLSGTGASLIGSVREWIDGSQDPVEVSSDTVQNALPVVTTITGGVVAVVTTLVVTFYYLMEKAFIRKLVISQLSATQQPRVDRIWQDVENKVGAWMRGQLFLCLIIGSIATISYGVLGITFWPLLGLWAGVTEIIPIVGPWLGGVPAVIVALTMGWDKAVMVAIVIVSMQTLENWFLVPRVMRGAVGLSPLTVFVAILAGTQFMGVTGAVLAIPIAAAVQVILTDYFATRAGRRESAMTSGWRWMLSRAAREFEQFDDELKDGNGHEPPAGHDAGGEWQAESRNVTPGVSRPADAEPVPSTTGRSGERPAAVTRQRTWAPFGQLRTNGDEGEPDRDASSPRES